MAKNRNSEVKELEDYLVDEINKEIKKVGKGWKWLSYAVEKNGKYVFVEAESEQFDLLQKVLDRSTYKFKGFKRGEIADAISRIVNSER